ncbi:hypothetical protein ORJ66_16775 [Pseudoalteromonas tunicata]|uniref:alpha/beta fold hydrolase n=1 Tax=Pseudoalteromonas tunicata TaxID=314281 RepID=UPI00273F51B9|nr:hypothetical protein [Pseudoalteromonas tunicata]MDP5214706.1 hypothetical protein [Pseudoalteromonas tunicata]
MKFKQLFFIGLLLCTGCSVIDKKITDTVTQSYVTLNFAQGAGYSKKKQCLAHGCIDYLFFAAKKYGKSEQYRQYDTQFELRIDEQVYQTQYNSFEHYQLFGSHYQGVAYLFPGFGVSNTTFWFYGQWLSDLGFDVVVLPGASQITPFDFGLSTKEFALAIADGKQPALVIGASLGFMAALDFATFSHAKKLVGLAPIEDARPGKLAINVMKTGWIPWYLKWLTVNQLTNSIEVLALNQQVLHHLHTHQERLAQYPQKRLLIKVNEDQVIGAAESDNLNLRDHETFYIEERHEVAASFPLTHVRQALYKFLKNEINQ